MSDEGTETTFEALLAGDGRPGALDELCVRTLLEQLLVMGWPDHAVTVTPAEGRLVGGVFDVRLMPRRPTYHCPRCGERRPLTAPCEHIDIAPEALERVRELFGDAEHEPAVTVRVVVSDALARGDWRKAAVFGLARVSREAVRAARKDHSKERE